MPDESAAAIRASVVLSQKLEQSAKLETLHVTEEGALNYEVKAAFLGTVASINADYTYEGSFGIDLQQVTMTRDGSVLTLTLPAPELLLDSLTPADITRDLRTVSLRRTRSGTLGRDRRGDGGDRCAVDGGRGRVHCPLRAREMIFSCFSA